MEIKVIVFDGDGVLYNSYKSSLKKIREMEKEIFGRIITTENELKHVWGLPAKKFVNTLYPFASAEQKKELINKWHEKDLKRKIKLLPGVNETLKILKNQGYILGFLTNRRDNSILRNIIQKTGLDLSCFAFIQTYKVTNPAPARPASRSEAGEQARYEADNNPPLEPLPVPYHFESDFPKPDLRLWSQIDSWLARQNLSAENILFIGDSHTDALCAQNKNLRYLIILKGSPITSKKEWKKMFNVPSAHIIKDIRDLPKWLKK